VRAWFVVTGVVLLGACLASTPIVPVDDAPDAANDREDHYAVWLGGARVGTAIERETWTPSGVTLRRDETMKFLRGDATISLATTIEIQASRALVATRVRWTERQSAQPLTARQPKPEEQRRAEATRDAAGNWKTSDGTTLPGAVVPAELVPLLLRAAWTKGGTFEGRVFLPSRGFLTGAGRIDRISVRRLIARLALDGGAVAEATIDTTDDGTYTRVVDGEGVIAIRTTADQAAEAFQPVDLIAATSIPISGTPTKTLVFDGGIAVPSLPGQLARPEADGVALELSPQLPGDLPYGVFGRDRGPEIKQLVRGVRSRIAPDLGAHPGSPRDAHTATAGDCTTFALAYASLATQRAIPTRVVTGLRVDGGRLVRHRWAVSWTGRAWIAVDAAFGAVPAGGDLIGLSIHDGDDAGLVAGEAALAQVRSASWR
jgi:hypothetical protein